MICLRCGYCCIHYLVVIVDDPSKGITEDNLIVHEGKGPCKHLLGHTPGEYSCLVHDRAWYTETPCFQHTQIGREDEPCRLGEYILKKHQLATSSTLMGSVGANLSIISLSRSHNSSE